MRFANAAELSRLFFCCSHILNPYLFGGRRRRPIHRPQESRILRAEVHYTHNHPVAALWSAGVEPSPPSFIENEALLSRAQTYSSVISGGIFGHHRRHSCNTCRLLFDGRDDEIPAQHRDDDHAKGQEAENEVLVERERVAVLDGPGKGSRGSDRAGCPRQ